jgi:hypothetical protein
MKPNDFDGKRLRRPKAVLEPLGRLAFQASQSIGFETGDGQLEGVVVQVVACPTQVVQRSVDAGKGVVRVRENGHRKTSQKPGNKVRINAQLLQAAAKQAFQRPCGRGSFGEKGYHVQTVVPLHMGVNKKDGLHVGVSAKGFWVSDG